MTINVTHFIFQASELTVRERAGGLWAGERWQRRIKPAEEVVEDVECKNGRSELEDHDNS